MPGPAPLPAREASPTPPDPSGARTSAPSAGEPEQEEPEQDWDDPMGAVLLGLELRYVHFNEASFSIDGSGALPDTGDIPPGLEGKLADATLEGRVPARDNVAIVLPLNVGGSGFGVDLQPSLSFGDVSALGLYFGSALHISLGRLYVDLGLGVQGGWWIEKGIDLGVDIHGRLPVGLTYYVTPDVGLFLALGLMYGGTAYKIAKGKTEFGTAGGFDLGMGIRFP